MNIKQKLRIKTTRNGYRYILKSNFVGSFYKKSDKIVYKYFKGKYVKFLSLD